MPVRAMLGDRHTCTYDVGLLSWILIFLSVNTSWGSVVGSGLWCNTDHTTQGYYLQQLEIDELGCHRPEHGDSRDWPGAPRDLLTATSGSNFTLRWKLPDDVSAAYIEGFKMEFYLEDLLKFNMVPGVCYFVNVSRSFVRDRSEDPGLEVDCVYRTGGCATVQVVIQSFPPPAGLHVFKEASDRIKSSGCRPDPTSTSSTVTSRSPQHPATTGGPNDKSSDLATILSASLGCSVGAVVVVLAFICYKRRTMHTHTAEITDLDQDRDDYAPAVNTECARLATCTPVGPGATSRHEHSRQGVRQTPCSSLENRASHITHSLPESFRMQILEYNKFR